MFATHGSVVQDPGKAIPAWSTHSLPRAPQPAPTAASHYPPRTRLSKTVMRNPRGRYSTCTADEIANRRRERIRRHTIPALQEPRRILDTAPARTVHHDHFMRREIPEPQPPISSLLLRLHENKIRTPRTPRPPFCRRICACLAPRIHIARIEGREDHIAVLVGQRAGAIDVIAQPFCRASTRPSGSGLSQPLQADELSQLPESPGSVWA